MNDSRPRDYATTDARHHVVGLAIREYLVPDQQNRWAAQNVARKAIEAEDVLFTQMLADFEAERDRAVNPSPDFWRGVEETLRALHERWVWTP